MQLYLFVVIYSYYAKKKCSIKVFLTRQNDGLHLRVFPQHPHHQLPEVVRVNELTEGTATAPHRQGRAILLRYVSLKKNNWHHKAGCNFFAVFSYSWNQEQLLNFTSSCRKQLVQFEIVQVLDFIKL